MNILSVDSLAKSFADKQLFQNLSFGIDKGQKIGVIAENGAGKSTLFRIILGKDIQDAGKVVVSKDIVVGTLEQEPDIDPNHTVQSYIEDGNKRLILLERYNKMLSDGQVEGHEFEQLSNEIDAQSAWDEESKIKEVLGSLKFSDPNQSTKLLSGGEKRRLALAKVLIDRPDLILLDEPTNHLDYTMVEWLENFLLKSPSALLIITHDRYFLDNVCDQILELTTQGGYKHKGNYEDFLYAKAEREENLSAQISKAKNLYKKELEWLRRMPKARGTKSKSRIEAAHELEKISKQKIKKHELEISSNTSRLGKKVIEVKRLNKHFGNNHIINDFNYFFKNGDKLGIVGKNGCGKSTFLNIITGKDKDITGHVSIGDSVKIGYYTQNGLKAKPGQRVIDVVKEIAEVVTLKDGSKITASQMLNKFNFDPKKQNDFVDKLSGGEKKRLYLVVILMEEPNFLILDEPTNDLDLLTLSVLENYLKEFKGCLLIVSHDRYFLDRIVDYLFVFEGEGKIKHFPGNFTQWKSTLKPEKEQKKISSTPISESTETPIKSEKKASKLSYMDQREFDQLEKDIDELESKKSELEMSLSKMTPDDIQKASIQLGNIIEEIEEKTMRWMELADKTN